MTVAEGAPSPGVNIDRRAPTADEAAAEVALSARGLKKTFAGFTAVNGVDLDVRRGAIHALIGPNGAGKSTVFNLLTGFLAPSGGRIWFEGREITGASPPEVVRLGLARSFQISAVFPHLTVLDNVRVALQRKEGLATQFWRSNRALERLDARAGELLEAVGLAEEADRLAAELSYGGKRTLEIATTLALDPRLMLLDEPMAGMASADIARIADLIREVAKGRTVLMVEHNLNVVADLCDRVTVLARGEVLAEGDFAAMRDDPRVREAYIGAADA